jgi:hypothetical protein
VGGAAKPGGARRSELHLGGNAGSPLPDASGHSSGQGSPRDSCGPPSSGGTRGASSDDGSAPDCDTNDAAVAAATAAAADSRGAPAAQCSAGASQRARRLRRVRTHVSLADFPEGLLPWGAAAPAADVLAPRGLLRPPPARVAKAACELRGLEGAFGGSSSGAGGGGGGGGDGGSLLARAAFSYAEPSRALRAAVTVRPRAEQASGEMGGLPVAA